MIVEKGVPGIGVDLDVVVDSVGAQRLLKTARCLAQRTIPGTVTADHRAGTSQQVLGVLRHAAVVDA